MSSASRKIVKSEAAPAAIGPYSQAIAAGGFLFASGQIPIDPRTGAFVPGGIEEQATQVLENLGAVLKAGGCGFGDVVKATIFLADIADFGVVNTIYAKYFGESLPARSCFAVSALPKGARIEIEVIAAIPKA
jgi:2-iminobutanoate/2-iminopropanoate deaminase